MNSIAHALTLDQLLTLAAIHNRTTSSRLCLDDADRLRSNGDMVASRRRALDSLRHSLGAFHPTFLRASI
jgi:hypothetical protein